jgi:hypothetical protein
MQRKLLLVFGSLFLIIIATGFFGPTLNQAKPSFHTEKEKEAFQKFMMNPIDTGEYFLESTHCQGCHGFDSTHQANVTEDGNSVNLFDHWESTMMANATRDPFWRAKVSQEILINPGHAAGLQDKCLDCHAPMGRYTSLFHGMPHYALTDLANDSLGRDGVSCAGCHTVDSTVGHTYSGIIPYDTTHTIYGPFEFPSTGPMQLYEGYTPTFSTHMNQARFCSPCHTLITESVDLSGNYTGNSFVEQATYHEYLNSRFPADAITCQTCHMPHLDEAILIANGFTALQPRFPFNQHTFVGGNSFMVRMIKDNKFTLGATAEDWQFDSTITATNELLRNGINMQLHLDSTASGNSYFSVRIENKAGHKFPSGYPARRAVVQLLVIDAVGDTVFHSGTFTSDYRVIGETPQFEPHHDLISTSDVPQIYELIMGDINHNFTSVLERANFILKDNRIPPQGFTTTAAMYDTVKISNDALADDDFNKTNSIEGSGVDYVHYAVPLSVVSGTASIYARIFYQSVPPKWVDELFAYSTTEIDTFRNMYNNADHTPILISSDSILNVPLATNNINAVSNTIKVYPTISGDGKVTVQSLSGSGIDEITVYDSHGRITSQRAYVAEKSIVITIPNQVGMYFLKILSDSKVFYRKILRQ